MNLLDLMIKVGVDDQATAGLDGIVGNVKNAASKVGVALKSAFDVGVKVTGVAASAFAALGGLALDATGELEQNSGGMLQVFQENAAEMESVAKTAYKNMGLSASDFMATVNQMGALLQGSGFSIDESATLAADAMQRAADVASIMGIDVSQAMESIAGAAKGNFTMMDNLGVAINDTTIANYALSKGITKSTREMTTQEKVGLALELFMEKSAYAAGNYARENETLAGSFTTAKAAMNNFLSGAGSAADVVESLSNAAKVVVVNVKEIAPRLAEGIGEMAGSLVVEIPAIFESVLPAVVTGVSSVFEAIFSQSDALVYAAHQLMLSIGEGMISAAWSIGPAITSILDSIGLYFMEDSDKYVEIGAKILSGLADGITTGISSLVINGADIISAVAANIEVALPIMAETGAKIVRTLKESVSYGIATIAAAFADLTGIDLSGLATMLQPVADGARRLFDVFKGAAPDIIRSVGYAFAEFGKWFNTSLAPAIGSVADGVLKLLDPFAEGVSVLIVEISDALGRVFAYATESKANPMQRISESFSRFVDAFKPYLSETIKNIAESIGNLFEAIGTGVIDRLNYFADAIERGDGFISLLAAHIGETIVKLSEFVLAMTDSETSVEEKLTKLGEVFGNVFSNIKTELKEVADFIIQKFNQIKDFIENFDLSVAIDKVKTKVSETLENVKAGWNAFWQGAESGYEEAENRNVARTTYASPSVQVPYDQSAVGRSAADIANTVIAGATQGGTTNINLNLDGRTVAQVVYDNYDGITKQKGVPVRG